MEEALLIRNGLLVSNEYDCQKADILIKGNTIVRIGDHLVGATGTRVVDANGLYVAPGFVNIHGHDDFYLAEHEQDFLKSICYQGVTTSISGNCGISNYPIDNDRNMEIDSYQGFLHYDPHSPSYTSLSEFIKDSKGRMTFNMVPLVGHGTLRINSNGFGRNLDKAAREMMKRQLLEFLEQGGWGLSSGLMYMPGTFSDTKELVELIHAIPDTSDLLYASHLRGYSDTFLAAVQEAIDIAEKTGITVECSHLGPFGVQYKQELVLALELIEKANARGFRVGFDSLAYCGGSTTIMAIVPPWFYTDGIDGFLERLHDDTFFKLLIETMETYVPTWPSWEGEGWTDNFVRCLGWQNLIVLSSQNSAWQGKSFVEIAKEHHLSIPEAFRTVMLDERGRAVMLMAGVGTCLDEKTGDMSGFDRMIEHPLSTVGIDAIFNKGGRTMPYAFGTFPKVVNRYVKQKKSIDLQTAIRKFTIEPLRKFGISDRGVLQENAVADIVIFNLDEMQDHSDIYAEHQHLATGVEYLMVNGGIVIDHKRFISDAQYGEVILHRKS